MSPTPLHLFLRGVIGDQEHHHVHRCFAQDPEPQDQNSWDLWMLVPQNMVTEPHIHYPSESMVQPSAGSSLAYLRHPQQKWSEICLAFFPPTMQLKINPKPAIPEPFLHKCAVTNRTVPSPFKTGGASQTSPSSKANKGASIHAMAGM